MEPPRTVTVGDTDYTIRPFKGFKALLAIEAVSGIAETMPAIFDEMSDFAKRYREKNTVVLDRATAVARFGDLRGAVSNKDWEASGNKLSVPQEPSTAEQVLSVLPKITAAARDQVVTLIALVVIADSELEKADEEGNVSEVVDKFGKQLLHKGELSELADLIEAAGAMLGDQLGGKLEGLMTGWEKARTLIEGPGPESETPEDDPEQSPSPTSPETSKPTSSTDSPPPTDGADERSSTEPVGATSSSSPNE